MELDVRKRLKEKKVNVLFMKKWKCTHLERKCNVEESKQMEKDVKCKHQAKVGIVITMIKEFKK